MLTFFTAGVITASDSCYVGNRKDESGNTAVEILRNKGYEIVKYIILPDDLEQIAGEIVFMSDDLRVDLVITTGGTGFSKRDITPEATASVVKRPVPGISEAIRNYSLKITPRAMLSRGISGIRNNTLIVNLPGSPKAVKEALEYIIDSLYHGLEILTGRAGNCAG